mgnify:CR=1 FL=1
MVLGEVLNDRGNWSGYLPHRHPQPETYFFKVSIIRKDLEQALSVIRYLRVQTRAFPQFQEESFIRMAVAPGYQMYTCWMIRHIDGNPWLQTDRCEDERYTWLHDAEFLMDSEILILGS